MSKGRPEKNPTKIIREYLEKYKDDIISGKVSKKGLARSIYDMYPNVFKSVEQVRGTIRSLTGANQKDVISLFDFKSTIQHGLKSTIPASRSEGAKDFVIEKVKKMLTFMDVHIPYHSVKPIEAMFAFVADKGIDGILINGDLIDMYMISRWNKDPDKTTMKEELEMTKEFFTFLREMFPKIPVYYKLGNHEDRWENYLKQNAAALYGMEFLNLETVLELARFNIQLVGSKTRIKFGKLNIIHGHEFGESIFSPVNPARGLFLRAKCSTLCGHHHQTSEHHENNLNSDSMACFTVGCMCDLNPDYRPFASTKWNHGFAVIERLEKDGFRVNNYRVIDGQVI
jgi:hypothetical protein